MEAKTFALMPVKEKSCFGFTSIKTKKYFGRGTFGARKER